jgi:hypothetical protein
MLMAPFLAVVMALLIAGAVTVFLPLNQPDDSKVVYASGLNGVQPQPTVGQITPTSASAADLYFLPSILALIVVGIVVGVAVVLLFFRREPQ